MKLAQEKCIPKEHDNVFITNRLHETSIKGSIAELTRHTHTQTVKKEQAQRGAFRRIDNGASTINPKCNKENILFLASG